MTRWPATRSRLYPSSCPSKRLISPVSFARAVMAILRRRRGSGANDLTNSSTCDSTWTLVLIETGNVFHRRFPALIVPNRLHRFRVAQDFKGFDDGCHSIAL